jgi:hypothetical protein
LVESNELLRSPFVLCPGFTLISTTLIVILGYQLAKCPTAKSQPWLFRPAVQCEMAKSLFARKDRGSGLGLSGRRQSVFGPSGSYYKF